MTLHKYLFWIEIFCKFDKTSSSLTRFKNIKTSFSFTLSAFLKKKVNNSHFSKFCQINNMLSECRILYIVNNCRGITV